MIHAFWIIPLVLLITFLASPRFRGDIAETRVRRILAGKLEKNRYTILNNVTLPSGGGTVHIDHLVVSRLGVFVIESQYARGWVSGGEFQERWKQKKAGGTVLFDNPAHRNALQVQALSGFLNAPSSVFHPIVVLVGQKGFKTPMPGHVIPPEKLTDVIRRKAQPLLEADQADRILMSIDSGRIRTGSWGQAVKLNIVRAVLFTLLVAGLFFAFREPVTELLHSMQEGTQRATAPEQYRADGTPKSEQELWEDSLICAYSVDTGRCACYEPDGSPVKLDTAKCRSLAERGSILKQ
ncbi:MAG: NERD domain-containing protein [Xanthomonadales bacterium]|nr:NERD domain-containing protein [Gammaproteobacteria bacterium]NND56382.1 NERD domain-containing protein [Xanthomonadales bacterium]